MAPVSLLARAVVDQHRLAARAGARGGSATRRRPTGSSASCVELVERHGFREYYNPLNGEGLAARRFGWSTLLVDLLVDVDGGGGGGAEAPGDGRFRAAFATSYARWAPRPPARPRAG